MKANYLTIFAILATFTAAQSNIQALPECARTCVTSFTSGSNIGSCSSTDIKCICSSGTFLSDIACCLAGKCDAADQQSATNFAQQFCGISGVTGLPTAVSCTSTSSSANGASSTASMSATSSSPTSAPSSSPTSAPSSSPTSAPSSSSTSASSSSSTSATPNAGAQSVAGIGAGIFGAALAVLI